MNNPKFISFAESGIDFIDGDRGTNYPSKSELIANGYCVFLNTGNVKKTGFDFTQVEFIDEEKDKKLRKGKVRQGDIVLTTRGTVGNVALVTSDTPFKNIRINSGMVIVRTDPEKYDPYFILLFFRSSLFQKQCLSHGSGSAQPQLPISALKYISFPNIAIDHQRKVVSAASCIDKKIELNNRINAELEAMAKTLYDYWFVQFDFPDDSPQGKPYKTSGGKMVYNPTLKREIPEGWSVVPLNKLVHLVKGNVSPSEIDPSTPYIGLEHIQRKRLALEDWASSDTAESDKTVFEKGDILFGKIRPYFHKVAVAPFDGITSTDTLIFRPSSKNYFGVALEVIFSEEFVLLASQSSTGSKMPRADWNVLKKYPIAIPRENLLERFQVQIEKVLDHLNLTTLENRELRELRDWLLPMLMNGQVTVGEAS